MLSRRCPCCCHLHSELSTPASFTHTVAAGKHIPMVLCGNKVSSALLLRYCPSYPPSLTCCQVDAVKERVVKPKQINFHRKKNLQYALPPLLLPPVPTRP